MVKRKDKRKERKMMVAIAKENLDRKRRLAQFRKSSSETHAKIKAAGFTGDDIEKLVEQAIKEKRNASKGSH